MKLPACMLPKPRPKPKGHRHGRRAGGQLKRVRRAVKFRDGGQCRVCVRGNGTELHHIVFRSLGGKHSTANCILICWDCHQAIHATRRLVVTGDANVALVIQWKQTNAA